MYNTISVCDHIFTSFLLTKQMLTKVRFITNVGFALFVGLAYQFIGNNASLTLNNAAMLFFSQVFIVFTSVMPTIVTCKYRNILVLLT